LDVGHGLVRPSDLAHPRMRHFASSWLTVRPALA
jgi:hypothetical protein